MPCPVRALPVAPRVVDAPPAARERRARRAAQDRQARVAEEPAEEAQAERKGGRAAPEAEAPSRAHPRGSSSLSLTSSINLARRPTPGASSVRSAVAANACRTTNAIATAERGAATPKTSVASPAAAWEAAARADKVAADPEERRPRGPLARARREGSPLARVAVPPTARFGRSTR